MRVDFTPLMPQHSTIAHHLRQSDLDEIALLSGLPPDLAVAFSIAHSEKGFAAFIDGVLAAVFGVSNGFIWLVGSEAVNAHPVSFFRASRKIFHQLRNGYSSLENFIDARNHLSLRWLKWLGFNVQPFGFKQGIQVFHASWKEDDSCVH